MTPRKSKNRCPSCNTLWTEHLGIEGTCRNLKAANGALNAMMADSSASMTAMAEALGVSLENVVGISLEDRMLRRAEELRLIVWHVPPVGDLLTDGQLKTARAAWRREHTKKRGKK